MNTGLAYAKLNAGGFLPLAAYGLDLLLISP